MRLVLFCLTVIFAGHAIASGHVNILVYHHVSESTPASTSISPAAFRSHMQLLKDNGFNVVSLETAIKGITEGITLPENAVAITFDDGFENIYNNGWPILKEFNYPFTIFVATDSIDERYSQMLSWDQLRELKAAGVSIANHSSDHDYLVRHRKLDSEWLAKTVDNISHAQNRLVEELGPDIPKWFAYPYGEFNTELASALKDQDYIAFAQHSGGAWLGSNFQAIPRFAAAGIYANPKTLITKLQSRPMPVNEATLADMVTDQSQPELLAEVLDRSDMSAVLNCFADGDWQDSTWVSDTTFRVKSDKALSEGRHRYNCTAKSKTGDFYYWYSKPWLILEQETAR
jgi:peptidoglycan/xylan/chitin deacetylase (PgdA/CDA1 family)